MRGCGSLNKAFLYSNCYQVIEVKLVLLATNKQTNKVILKVEWPKAQREWEWAQTVTASRVKLGKHCGVALLLSTSLPSSKVAPDGAVTEGSETQGIFHGISHSNPCQPNAQSWDPHPLSSEAELSWWGVSALLRKKSIRVHWERREYSVAPPPLVYLKQSLFINKCSYSCSMQ